jgi:DNA methylase N-4/N-6 domain protein
MKPERLEHTSVDGSKLNLEALYQIAPSCFTEEKDEKTGIVKHVVNFKTLRQLLGGDAVDEDEEMYQFTWPGKRAARYEAAEPIDDTLRPVPADSVDWDTTENLYIEGDNLRVLKLLQRGYMGKVKMIYIDPPYNTGNDFVYHDDFAHSAEEEELAAGNIDEEGYRYRRNLDSNGRFHSDWCSMMYSRLLVARSLLTEDGVIFISIDDNEVENLRKICDEIYGSQNHIETVVWKNKYGAGAKTVGFISAHEYILVYSKTPITDLTCEFVGEEREKYNKKDDKFDKRGPYRTQPLMTNSLGDRPNLMYSIFHNGVEIKPRKQWVWSKERMEAAITNDDVEFSLQKDGTYTVRSKSYLYDENGHIRRGKPVSVMNGPFTQDGTLAIRDLFEGKSIFDFTKPSELIKFFVGLEINDDSSREFIVLDFFSGSATTAHAVMQLNAEDGGKRKYICVQLPEETPEGSEARKAGYATIPEIAKERIRRAGKKIKEESPLATQDLDTGFRVFRIDSGNYKDVTMQPNEYNQQMLDLFVDNIKADRTDLDLLFGAMLAWGVQLSLPMTTEEVDGCKIYAVDGNGLVACFAENISENVVQAMAAKQPLRVLFRDSCFDEDKTKINIFERFKQQLDWDEKEAIQNIRVV